MTFPLGALARVSLDGPMAALAGLSVGFVAFAMPDSVLSDAIRTSGLPMILPAAEPPLGLDARLGLVALAAVATFLFVWFLLRALGSGPPESRLPDMLELDLEQVPRLRRADAHPDAPSRRPLFARDLGEPVDDLPPVDWSPAPEPLEIVEEAVEALPSREREEPSIASLMQRLERGLVRRQREALDRTPEPAPIVARADDPVDARLRDALSDLQRMTARHG